MGGYLVCLIGFAICLTLMKNWIQRRNIMRGAPARLEAWKEAGCPTIEFDDDGNILKVTYEDNKDVPS